MSKEFRGRIYDSILDTIGATPIVRLPRLQSHFKLDADLMAKLEFFNPLSSVKDRIALSMLETAEKDGAIIAGETTLIEPTSGNTGIGLAFVAAAKGYKLILTMPESMSLERRKMLRLLGAELVLTPKEQGMKGAIEKAGELQAETKNSVILGQFSNPSNPEIHKHTTAEEIWQDTGGDVDIIIFGVGTGGTITGVAQQLKARKSSLHIVAVEPSGSAVLSGGDPGPHMIQGIGAGFTPEILDTDIIDEIVLVDNDQAFEMSRLVARLEGVTVGISSGAALQAAIQLAGKNENKGKKILVIIPSSAERYLSTALFDGLEA